MPDSTTIDIGRAFSQLMADPDWFKKYALAGIMLLIPVVGPLVFLGWARRVYDAAKAGDDTRLPTVDFGNDLQYGIAPFVAALELAILVVATFVIVVMMAVVLPGGVAAILGSNPDNHVPEVTGGLVLTVVWLLCFFLLLVVMVVSALVAPEVKRRGFNGEMLPLFKPGPSLRAIRRNLGPYLMLFLGGLIGGIIGSIGGVACYVGLFVTVPISNVFTARLLAQWDLIVGGEAP